MARPEIWVGHIACREAARRFSGKQNRKAWEAHARGGSIPAVGLRPTSNNVAGTKIGRLNPLLASSVFHFVLHFFIPSPLRVFMRWLCFVETFFE